MKIWEIITSISDLHLKGGLGSADIFLMWRILLLRGSGIKSQSRSRTEHFNINTLIVILLDYYFNLTNISNLIDRVLMHFLAVAYFWPPCRPVFAEAAVFRKVSGRSIHYPHFRSIQTPQMSFQFRDKQGRNLESCITFYVYCCAMFVNFNALKNPIFPFLRFLIGPLHSEHSPLGQSLDRQWFCCPWFG